jgi:hypothetical protein
MASASVPQPKYTATVYATDGIRFTASAECPQHLLAQIVSYIRERCDHVLWPAAASEVNSLLDDDKPYAAIALYFANVGERWDQERLQFGGLSFGVLDSADTSLTEASWDHRLELPSDSYQRVIATGPP